MPKKKNSKPEPKKAISKGTADRTPADEESIAGEEPSIDAAIIEDTFTEEFSEYNDVDNF